jgi:mono/diheme cytochrome c family protein
MPDGQIFDVITNGVRTMPSYAVQVSPEDRWAIVAYVRALERSQKPLLGDIPADRLEELKKPQ